MARTKSKPSKAQPKARKNRDESPLRKESSSEKPKESLAKTVELESSEKLLQSDAPESAASVEEIKPLKISIPSVAVESATETFWIYMVSEIRHNLRGPDFELYQKGFHDKRLADKYLEKRLKRHGQDTTFKQTKYCDTICYSSTSLSKKLYGRYSLIQFRREMIEVK